MFGSCAVEDCVCQRYSEYGTAAVPLTKGQKSGRIKSLPVCVCGHFSNSHRDAEVKSSIPVTSQASGEGLPSPFTQASMDRTILVQDGRHISASTRKPKKDGSEAEVLGLFANKGTHNLKPKNEVKSVGITELRFKKIMLVPSSYDGKLPMSYSPDGVQKSAEYKRFLDSGFIVQNVILSIRIRHDDTKPPLQAALETLFVQVSRCNGLSQGFDFIKRSQSYGQETTEFSSESDIPWDFLRSQSKTHASMLVVKLRDPSITLEKCTLVDLTEDLDGERTSNSSQPIIDVGSQPYNCLNSSLKSGGRMSTSRNLLCPA